MHYCGNRWNGVSRASILTLSQMALKLEMSKKKDIRIIKDLAIMPQQKFERDRRLLYEKEAIKHPQRVGKSQ